LLLVFVSGILVGGFGHRLYTASSVEASRRVKSSSEEYRRKYVEEMRSRLHLTEDQVTQLHAALDKTREQYRAFHERTRPEMNAIEDERRNRINSFLNDVQRQEYAKMVAEREKNKKPRGH
jgi:hypothetical protein